MDSTIEAHHVNDEELINETKLAEVVESPEETTESKDLCNEVEITESGQVEEQDESTKELTVAPVVPSASTIHDEVKKLIEQHAKTFGLNNITVDIAPGSNLGDNFMGFIGKLTINGTDKKGSPKIFNWMVKTAPDIELYRMALNVTALYAREAYAYEDIFPVYKQYQLEKRILKPFNEHPDLIFTHIVHMVETIVMQDMKSIGYLMRNRQESLDWNHVKLVLKAYGKLHAMSYILKDQKPELFIKLAANTEDVFKDAFKREDSYKSQQPLIDSALATLDPVMDARARVKFQRFTERFVDIVKEKTLQTNRYSVIGHGDSWVNNILWKYGDPTKPTIATNICLLDWQLCRYGSPALDLSYFLFACTTKEFRDQHYDSAIRFYYYTLCSHLIELGGDPEMLLPYEILQQELKSSAIIGIYFSICVLYVITRETTEIPEWRSNDANAEEIGNKWFQKSVNADEYEHRVRGVIVDAYENGYLNFIQ